MPLLLALALTLTHGHAQQATDVTATFSDLHIGEPAVCIDETGERRVSETIDVRVCGSSVEAVTQALRSPVWAHIEYEADVAVAVNAAAIGSQHAWKATASGTADVIADISLTILWNEKIIARAKTVARITLSDSMSLSKACEEPQPGKDTRTPDYSVSVEPAQATFHGLFPRLFPGPLGGKVRRAISARLSTSIPAQIEATIKKQIEAKIATYVTARDEILARLLAKLPEDCGECSESVSSN